LINTQYFLEVYMSSNSKYTILVVDDSAVERLHLTQILKNQGYNVIEASNGDDAFVLAKAQTPALVLMDVVMPGTNGFQATRQFSRDESLAGVPVIMSTSKDAETDRVWAARQGAKGYLIKPIKSESLVALLNKFLHTPATL
jgi:twitching motility two-component system response regulator PilH